MTAMPTAIAASAIAFTAAWTAGVAGWGGGRLQFDYAMTVPILFAALWLAVAKGGRVAPAAVCAAAVALGLGDAWYGLASTGAYVGGILPIADARGYLEEALRLLAGARFETIAARRPVFGGVLAGLLWSVGDLRIVVTILAFATALGFAAALGAFARHHGALAAAAFGVLAFLFARRFVGTTLTESLAVPLALFAFALIWRAPDGLARAAAGLALLSLAMGVRAGPFFVLPLLVLALAWTPNRAAIPGRLAVLALCAAAPHIVVHLVAPLVAVPGVALANAAQTLYGVVHGGDWTTYFARHPEMAAVSDAALSRAIYADLWRTVGESPAVVWDGAVRAWRAFFLSPIGVVSFVANTDIAALRAAEGFNARQAEAGLSAALIDTVATAAGWDVLIRRAISLGIAGASLVAVLRAPFVRFENRTVFVLVAFWLGIVASVPFLPPWDADSLRAYAAVIPFFAAGAALAFHRRTPVARGLVSASPPLVRWQILVTAIAILGLPMAGPAVLGRGGPGAAECPSSPADFGIRVAVAPDAQARWQGGLDVVSALYPRLGEGLSTLTPPIEIDGVYVRSLDAMVYRVGGECGAGELRMEGFAIRPDRSKDRN
ncbi:MAG: hypothetical protein ING19_20190 [Azospirillum sp.]|nr:hypothetical protein [Azospirillum sp.]